MFGIITALPIEARCFSKLVRAKDEIYILNQKVLISASGIGSEKAQKTANDLVDMGAKSLISFGTAAGLVPGLHSGVVCMPQILIDPFENTFQTDMSLRKQILRDLINKITIIDEKMTHASDILKTEKQKLMLYQKTGAVAADMESFGIAKVAHEAQIPFLILRVIVDPLNFDMSKLLDNHVFHNGEISYKHLFSLLSHQPQLLISLIQMANYFNKARKSMRLIARGSFNSF